MRWLRTCMSADPFWFLELFSFHFWHIWFLVVWQKGIIHECIHTPCSGIQNRRACQGWQLERICLIKRSQILKVDCAVRYGFTFPTKGLKELFVMCVLFTGLRYEKEKVCEQLHGMGQQKFKGLYVYWSELIYSFGLCSSCFLAKCLWKWIHQRTTYVVLTFTVCNIRQFTMKSIC